MKVNVFGILSLICGIIGMILACIGFGIFPAIAGMIFSIIGFCQKNTKYGTSIAGMVCSVIGIAIFSLMFFIALFASDETTKEIANNKINESIISDIKESVAEEVAKEDNLIDCEVIDCTVKYVSHEVGYDRSDNKCVFVYYTFSNNNKETKSFGYTIDDKAFQNGVELEISYWEVEGYENNKYAEIKPGAEVTVACVYKLRDTSSVELDIRKMYDYNNKVIDSMTIELE